MGGKGGRVWGEQNMGEIQMVWKRKEGQQWSDWRIIDHAALGKGAGQMIENPKQ